MVRSERPWHCIVRRTFGLSTNRVYIDSNQDCHSVSKRKCCQEPEYAGTSGPFPVSKDLHRRKRAIRRTRQENCCEEYYTQAEMRNVNDSNMARQRRLRCSIWRT